MLDASHEDPAPSAAPLQGVQEDWQAHVSWRGFNWPFAVDYCGSPVPALSALKYMFLNPLLIVLADFFPSFPPHPGTTAFTWRPRVTCLRTSASSWSTFTSWRQTRPARSSWRKFRLSPIVYPWGCAPENVGLFTLPMLCLAATRPKLVVPRQRRPVSAERSVSRPRKRRSSRTCPRRRRQPRSNLNLMLLCWLTIKLYIKTLMTSTASFHGSVRAVLWSTSDL